MFLAFGKAIAEKMEGKDVVKYSLKRSEKVKTLETKTSVKVTGKDDAAIDFIYCFKDHLFWQRFQTSTLKTAKSMNCVHTASFI